ncbi:hypothetical protein [Mobilicoccus sp.]|uniref:hypothetical protein n=1 Tax=Mobilicoccus sp. TaxID=2034349 RepID=UPI0028ABD6D5|nr:hypothetical protein [Mobilicoccus sp.]
MEDLMLDLDNYRIPVRQDDENAALNYLFASEEVLEAARMILRDGYFDNEVPIVVRDGSRLTVLEGNRRVSALKALQDPDLVPDHREQILALKKRYAIEAQDLPTSVRVIIAPSREAAAPHVARLHTTVPKKRWSRDQQAKYYYSLLGPTTTVEDLKAAYPGVSVTRFIKMAVMRSFLSGVKFSDRTLHEYVTGDQLAMSSFEYAFKQPSIAEAMGAHFTRDGLLTPTNKTPEQIAAGLPQAQREAIEYLMAEFRAGRLNTRSLEFRKGSQDQQALLVRMARVESASSSAPTPNAPGGATGVPDSKHGDAERPDAATQAKRGAAGSASIKGLGSGRKGGSERGPNHPDTRDHLVLTGLDYATHAGANLQRRYQELRKLSLSDTPVAAAILLRAVLESTIKFHFEGTSTPASGELKQCMALVKKVYGDDKSLRQAINKVDSGDAMTQGSVSWFNLIAHSADTVPAPKEVRDALALLEPLLRRLLRPPVSP